MNQPNFPQPNYGGYTPVPLPTSNLAIISLIAGILGFFLFPLIASIVAIITGNMARSETRANPPTASGDGLATAGIIMGWIQVGMAVVGICCAIIYFVFVVGLVGASQNFN
jgi:hypothetical protein